MKCLLQSAALLAATAAASHLSGPPSYKFRRDTLASNDSASSIKYSCPSNVTTSSDGFPCPNDQQLDDLEETAHGTILNLTLSGLGDFAITLLELGAYFESDEASFWDTIATNVSNGDAGFEANQTVLDNLITLRAQAEIRAVSFNNILADNGVAPIFACPPGSAVNPGGTAPTQPTSLAIAEIVADQFLEFDSWWATEIKRVAQEGTDANFDLLPILGSVALDKGEQIAFWRSLRGFNASGQPFPTGNSADYGFHFLQQTQPAGSCEAVDRLSKKLMLFGVLQVLNIPPFEFPPFGQDPPDATFTVNTTFLNSTAVDLLNNNELYGTYIHAQNPPISVPLLNRTQVSNLTYEISLSYPGATDKLFDGSWLVLTKGANFKDVFEATQATLTGPDVIILD